MNQSATITSKMQLTIPMAVAKKAGLVSGDKVAVSEEDGKIVLTPFRKLLAELAGSLSVPEKWKGIDIDQVIREAKMQHFQNKRV